MYGSTKRSNQKVIGAKRLMIGAILGGALLMAACGSGPKVVSPPTNTASSHTTSSTSTTATTSPPSSASLALETSPKGKVLTVKGGNTLYEFAPDTPTKSACVSTGCVGIWPPLTSTGTPEVSTGLKATLVGSLTRTDGSHQVTYNGHPLYLWVGDTGPGTFTGQDVPSEGGPWYVVNATGNPIKTKFPTS